MLLAPGLQSSRVWVAAPALGLAQGSGLPGRLRCGVTAPRSLIGSGPLDPQPANKASCDSPSIIDWLGQASLFPHREHCAALSALRRAGCSQFAAAELCHRPTDRPLPTDWPSDWPVAELRICVAESFRLTDQRDDHNHTQVLHDPPVGHRLRPLPPAPLIALHPDPLRSPV